MFFEVSVHGLYGTRLYGRVKGAMKSYDYEPRIVEYISNGL